MVMSVDREHRRFTASIEAIPGFMQAMVMPFEFARLDDVRGVVPGVVVEFTLVNRQGPARAERLRIVRYESAEQDPFTANRLELLRHIASPATPALVPTGAAVPDFTLIDQRRRPVTLSAFRGKVVAINFVYTSCRLPNFCLRIANHFGVLEKRFRGAIAQEFVLLTVTFDPLHDDSDVLAGYARQWHADPDHWHFLTGSVEEIKRVGGMFGVAAFADEGAMNHSLHTAIIDRRGALVANIEGNRFSSTQLGDLLNAALRHH